MRRVAGRSALAVLLMLGIEGCMNGSAEPPPKKSGDAFAADREEPIKPADFDAKRAHGYLEALCKIGPRISGSDGMKKQQQMLEKHFKDQGGQIDWQRFTATQKSDPRRQEVSMANLIVSWHPDRERRVILCSHYDTRPLADRERDARDWRKPFLSANDGGSGVALLMELAHHMKDMNLNVGVDFVIFDGEEYVFEERDEYFFGSKYFGRQYRRARGKPFYAAAILLDMVGGKKPHFPIDPYSWEHAADLVRAVWNIARELECSAFDANAVGQSMLDDHVALNQNGIPAIDIIDAKYPHWHKLSDVPDNCSGASMEQVAKVLSVWLQRVK
ncbi:MAG TPA: M28 family peptidase [Gemmataceae bacterium]|nr:M28 family peptidase [Gemmataceae bacterium]